MNTINQVNNKLAPMTSNQNTPENTLGKDAFLQILVSQLKHQDPMEPVKDRDFIAQMAQFSGLEQMSNLNKTMQLFVDYQIQGSLLDKSHLIGKEVQWEQNGVQGNGVIKAVLFKDGSLLAEIEGPNNITIPIESVVRVEGGN
jgi:flagellar basal-body rod modification protein FlgD